ncbi:MAG: lysylphosphatidylglycerol synthase transmembrane domain-containing protein [bacterium]
MIWNLLRGVFSLLLVGGVIYLSVTHYKQIGRILWSSPYVIGLLIGLQCIHYLAQGLSHLAVYRPFGVQLNVREWYGLTILNNVFNLFVPGRGGAVIRSGYLKSDHSLRIRDFLSATLFMGFLGLLVPALAGVLTGLANRVADPLWIHAVHLGALGAIVFVQRCPRYVEDVLNKLGSRNFDFRSFKKLGYSSVCCSVLASYALVTVARILRIYIVLEAVGVTLPIHRVIYLSLTLLVITDFPLVPGNFGVKETVLGVLMTTFGLSIESVVAVVLIERIVELIVLIPGSV